MTKFRRDERLKFTFADEFKNPFTAKKIYVKSVWQPDPGSKELEATIDLF